MKPFRTPRLGPKWKPRSVTDPALQACCEACARQIQRHVGGEIKRIMPIAPEGVEKESLLLGLYRGHHTGWHYHEVVIAKGKVYDAFTGHHGLPIEEFKALWEHREELDFGF